MTHRPTRRYAGHWMQAAGCQRTANLTGVLDAPKARACTGRIAVEALRSGWAALAGFGERHCIQGELLPRAYAVLGAGRSLEPRDAAGWACHALRESSHVRIRVQWAALAALRLGLRRKRAEGAGQARCLRFLALVLARRARLAVLLPGLRSFTLGTRNIAFARKTRVHGRAGKHYPVERAPLACAPVSFCKERRRAASAHGASRLERHSTSDARQAHACARCSNCCARSAASAVLAVVTRTGAGVPRPGRTRGAVGGVPAPGKCRVRPLWAGVAHGLAREGLILPHRARLATILFG